MVSLEDRTNYSLRINESPKLEAFNDLLLNRAIILPDIQEFNEADEVYFKLINAVQSDDKSKFEIYYNKKNKSNPTKESPSPFINDDFLVFTLIIGIERFNFNKDWIKNIVSVRSKNTITTTLENILNENYYSKDNIPEIVLVYCQLNNKALITDELLNFTFKSISENINIFNSKSDFQILCAIRSYNLIIELKEAPDGSEMKLLNEFNSRFLKRIKILSWIIQTLLFITIFYFAIELISFKPEIKSYFDKLGTILKISGLFGISQLGNIFPSVKAKSFEILLRIFGYPKDLIDRRYD